MPDGAVIGGPRVLLRLEGVCLLLAAAWAYAWLGQSWWIFAALLLVPDLSMLAYAATPAIGAALYNLTHTLSPPLIGLCLTLAYGRTDLAGLALIWLSHIGLDRALGYGLKYRRGFGHTHLGAIGRRQAVDEPPGTPSGTHPARDGSRSP
ncbi:DUF4260 domain-containing protein [Methylobacterium sp. J-070]|uniref:DUF4260 domain-containing protein n=1 Tax=Methylobacterium sp. J-070 TaxID=2836650 RepID=UPI001FBAF4C2|nr:DUF4260 domain-containing protein [Methylobacterium sp. J-070]MCJ2049626.1 DUF4260 domain-containing protein [Methylobacterium sp. J-070]